MAEDQRTSPRERVPEGAWKFATVQVLLGPEHLSPPQYCTIRDICAGGLGVSALRPIEPGREVFLQISLEPGLDVRLSAKVVHTRAGSGEWRMGLLVRELEPWMVNWLKGRQRGRSDSAGE